MAVKRDEFFSELDRLTEREIEERLPTWDMERLTLAQEYVEARLARPTETQSGQREAVEAAKTAALLALQAASGANRKAVAALILAVGAMLAAVMCGVIFVLRY